MPKIEGTVRTPDDTNNRLDGEFVLVTFRPGGDEPVTVEYYYDKNVYKDPYDFARTNQKVTVKYKSDNPMSYTVYPERMGSYSKYIGPAIIGAFFGFFIANASDGGMWIKIKVFVITFVITSVAAWLIYEFNARFAWLNFNSKRDDE